jgi:hypothetical protein
MRIEKRSYSRAPWRLVTEAGAEVYAQIAFDHPGLGMTAFNQPICGDTKTECIENALALLGKLLKRST